MREVVPDPCRSPGGGLEGRLGLGQASGAFPGEPEGPPSFLARESMEELGFLVLCVNAWAHGHKPGRDQLRLGGSPPGGEHTSGTPAETVA